MAIVDEEVHEEATPTETPQLDTSDQIIDWFESLEIDAYTTALLSK